MRLERSPRLRSWVIIAPGKGLLVALIQQLCGMITRDSGLAYLHCSRYLFPTREEKGMP